MRLAPISQDINSLIVGQDYWFTVDAYNGGGVTKGTTTAKLENKGTK